MPLLFQDVLEHLRESDDTARFIFVRPPIEPHGPSLYIYPVPGQRKNLASESPAGKVRKVERRTEMFRETNKNSLKLPGLKKSIASVILFEHGNVRLARNLLYLHG